MIRSPSDPAKPPGSSVLSKVEAYYSRKIESNGPVPSGVDWNGIESQELRFAQLLRIATRNPYALTDLGCGYGALYGYLSRRQIPVYYTDLDISSEMINQARQLYGDNADRRFLLAGKPNGISDNIGASGIFALQRVFLQKWCV